MMPNFLANEQVRAAEPRAGRVSCLGSWLLAAVFTAVSMFPAELQAQPRKTPEPRREAGKAEADPKPPCVRYRAVREGVPVYDKPSTGGSPVEKLHYGEYVCGTGSKDQFLIVDWSKQQYVNSGESILPASEAVNKEQLRYVELRELRLSYGVLDAVDPDFLLHKAQQQVQRMRFGAVPEDGLAPFRPLLAPFAKEPKCMAGKICKQLEPQK